MTIVQPPIIERALAPHLNRRSLHAVLFLLFFLATMHVPLAVRWPYYLLVPFLAYGLLCGAISPLRRSCVWIAWGKWDRLSRVAAAFVIALSTAALVLYQWVAAPDVRDLAARLPARVFGSVVLAGALFAVLNAILEELMFRGILYDALESQCGWRLAVGLERALFGILHVHGYPPGSLGVVLAGVYGLLLGWLRHRTQGLALPIVAHVCADAAIFSIFVHAGVL